MALPLSLSVLVEETHTEKTLNCSKGRVYVSRATVGIHALPICHSRKSFKPCRGILMEPLFIL